MAPIKSGDMDVFWGQEMIQDDSRHINISSIAYENS